MDKANNLLLMSILAAEAMSVPAISGGSVAYKKSELSKKQKKARQASKNARKARRKNRK